MARGLGVGGGLGTFSGMNMLKFIRKDWGIVMKLDQ